jgi:hypothetical protein
MVSTANGGNNGQMAKNSSKQAVEINNATGGMQRTGQNFDDGTLIHYGGEGSFRQG